MQMTKIALQDRGFISVPFAALIVDVQTSFLTHDLQGGHQADRSCSSILQISCLLYVRGPIFPLGQIIWSRKVAIAPSLNYTGSHIATKQANVSHIFERPS